MENEGFWQALGASVKAWVLKEAPWVDPVYQYLANRPFWFWLVVALLLLGMAIWGYNQHWESSRLGQAVARVWRRFKPLVGGSPTQFTVAVARLDGDEKGALRTRVLDALRTLPGVVLQRYDRDLPLAQAANVNTQVASNHAQARRWLKKSGGDLLLWGQVLPPVGNAETFLRLHITLRDSDELPESLRLSEAQTLDLPVAAQEALMAAVRIQVAARLASYDAAWPVAQQLQGEIGRLQAVVDKWSAGLSRAAMQTSLADAWQLVGDQLGNNDALDKAVALYRQALLEYTREQVPLQWAMTQNNLARIFHHKKVGTAFETA